MMFYILVLYIFGQINSIIMDSINIQELVLSLIKNDLINQKLLNGLADIGVEAGNYHLNIGTIVFNLLKIEMVSEDGSFDNYMRFAMLSKYVPLHGRAVDDLALEIFHYLDSLPKTDKPNS
jgi:hypothetical protein